MELKQRSRWRPVVITYSDNSSYEVSEQCDQIGRFIGLFAAF